LLVQAVRAEIPEAYHPIVVKAPFSLSERVFDLTPGFAKAKAMNMPVLVYLGAADCPPCKEYTKFLKEHEKTGPCPCQNSGCRHSHVAARGQDRFSD
jgi:thiol-disulfide isomerase/thioredoxin